jgi:hypothetical protein
MLFHLKKVSFTLAILPSIAMAIDLHPNDGIAPPPDIQMMQINYQRVERGDFYSKGNKALTGGEIVNTQMQLKYGRSFELNTLPAVFQIQAPLTEISTSGSSSSFTANSGAGDTSFTFALWPYVNRDAEKYLGVAGYLIVPTGSYDSQRNFNPGENRYRWALQAGYEQSISKRVNWMSAVDVLWYGENDDKAVTHEILKQKALYSAQTAFIYKFNSTYSTAIGYFYSVGGETSLNGVSQGDKTESHRYQLSGIGHFSFGRVSLQYGQELSTKNGFIEDSRWILRLTKYFR